MNTIIENKYFKAEISSFGAEIQHLVRKSDGKEIIWNGDSSVWKNHAPILFPFVARCLGGYFMIDGKKCEYTRNHGFARDLEHKLIESTESKVVYELTESKDTDYRFPYAFSLKTEYEVTENGLNWKITVTNTDTKAFKFGVGTHAAFACPTNVDSGKALTDYEVVFDENKPLTAVICNPESFLAADGNLTKPYGEAVTGVVPLTNAGFGNGHLFKNETCERVGLRDKATGKTTWINTKGFPYVMLWQNTSGSPQFVCIEPWHGISDHENTDHIWETKLGMNSVEPGQSFVSIQDITVE